MSILKSISQQLKNPIIKSQNLLAISALVAVVVNLPRLLVDLGLAQKTQSFWASSSVTETVMRIVLMTVFGFVILRLNSAKSAFDGRRHNAVTFGLNAGLYLAVIGLAYVLLLAIGAEISKGTLILLFVVYFVVFLIHFFIGRILDYQRTHQQDLLDKQQLKQQSIEYELAALRNQINPHFLFNALNSLSALVRENPEAKTFVSKLSFMYRYILQSGEKDLVTLEEELKFTESYAHLIGARYGDNFELKLELTPEVYKLSIPPLCLQLLVENAVKHNEISAQYKLMVHIIAQDNSISVSNKIVPRTHPAESTGHGLANIDQRFKLLKGRSIKIQQQADEFKVSLPL